MASTSRETVTKTPLNESEQKRLQDINMKLEIAKNVLECCRAEKEISRPEGEAASSRFKAYAGESYEQMFFDEDVQASSTRQRTLGTMMSFETGNYMLYTVIRNVIFDIYVNMRQLPTKSLLFQKLDINKPLKNDLNSTLKLAGFVWTPLPNLDRCILIEKPEIVAARFKYLKQMFKYRAEKRPIVYLDEGNFNTYNLLYKVNPKSLFAVAATADGVIDVHFQSELQDGLDLLGSFVERIRHLLPCRCVLVVYERPHHIRKTVPDEFSTREEMMDWLKDSKIPFEDSMHSGELFALIQRFKTKFPPVRFKLEDVAKQIDADVVYKPFIKPLNFFKNVKEIVGKLYRRTKQDIAGLKMAEHNWKNMEEDMIAVERQMFEEDMQMEVIIDQLMTMASDNKISPEEVKQLPMLKFNRTDYDSSDFVIL